MTMINLTFLVLSIIFLTWYYRQMIYKKLHGLILWVLFGVFVLDLLSRNGEDNTRGVRLLGFLQYFGFHLYTPYPLLVIARQDEAHPVECVGCFNDIDGGVGWRCSCTALSYCGSCFSLAAFSTWTRDNRQARPLSCSRCDGTASMQVCRSLMPPEEFAQYDAGLLRAALANMRDVVQCPGVDCVSVGFWPCKINEVWHHQPHNDSDPHTDNQDPSVRDSNAKATNKDILCDVCNTHYCLACGLVWSLDHNCVHEIQQQRGELIGVTDFYCPVCDTAIFKNGGCSEMSCTVCDSTFDLLNAHTWEEMIAKYH